MADFSMQYPHATKAHGGTYGNGQCFLFRLDPHPTTCRWQAANAAQDIIKQHAASKQNGGFLLPNASRHQSSHRLSALGQQSSSHKLSGRDLAAKANGEVSGNSKHSSRLGGSSKHGGEFSSSRHRGGQRGLLRSDSFGLGSVHRKASAATESFMMTTKEFLAMGVSPLTSNCGLKLYNDLTRGTSDVSETYGNERLVGSTVPDFAVTCVEVYAFE